MSDISKPLPFEELEVKPPLIGKIRISEDMQQTLSLLSGYDGAARRLIRVSPSGVLYIAEPRVQSIINVLGVGASYNWQGTELRTTEILVRADTVNTGLVWANVDAAAAPDTGYPLASGEFVRWTVTNLKNLYLHIVVAAERAIVVYSQ